MLIYFRHAHDEYEDNTFNHDNRLSPIGIDSCRKFARRIIKYGRQRRKNI